MKNYSIRISEIKEYAPVLKAGDSVLLSGTVYTARDAAHAKIFEMLDGGEQPPFDINGAVIYYAGPTPSKPDGTVGSFGPTTSSRMDAFSSRLLDMGLAAMIGKGNRDEKTNDAIVRNGAVYFCAGGGLGALISGCIKSVEVIAFPELGCESVKKLEVEKLPVYVGTDSSGNSVFDRR